jgi:hypothetical protein
MRRLFIHCGLARTGTTAIQRHFSQERANLRTIGIDYPNIGLNKAGIAHHGIADQILTRAEFSSGSGPVGDFLNFLDAPDRLSTVVISSEGFANCLHNRRTRERFLNFTRSARKINDGTFLVFRMRPFSQYFDSWYIQRLKIGGVPLDLSAYSQSCLRWLKTFLQGLSALKSALGAESIIIIDANAAGGDAVLAFSSHIGASAAEGTGTSERHNSRLSLTKAAIIYQLQSLAGSDSRDPNTDLARLRLAILKSKDFDEDVTDYRVIPFADANKIQSLARRCTPPFLEEPLSGMTAPEAEPYDAISLGQLKVFDGAIEQLKSFLPNDMQSTPLFEAWLAKQSATVWPPNGIAGPAPRRRLPGAEAGAATAVRSGRT